jgi:hypothetical protein
MDFARAGERENLEAKRPYHVEVTIRGSQVVLVVDGVKVCSTKLPFTLPQGQPGIWCQGTSDILIHNYKVIRETPSVFVIMQFTTPYNELYEEVIK